MATILERTNGAAAWPFRLALATALCAVPLVLFGGSVTTLGAGMAVEGWLVAEGHFLLFFPVDSWFRDTATFVEHTHRLFGVAVGLFAIGCLVATLVREDRRAAKLLSALALLAVCAQGAIGGFRVLENSPRLAFLHGALAQAVFALLCANAVFLSPAWRRGASGTLPEEAGRPGFRRLAALAAAVVYAQIVLGAAYRHALRPVAGEASATLLAAHLAGAFLVFAVVGLFASRALRLGGEGVLGRAPRRLAMLLGLQILLGLVAWVGYRPGAVGPFEWATSVAHVLVGGFLLAECVRDAMWSWRGAPQTRAVAGGRSLGRAGLEVAR